jgi:hypothetical protein
MLGRIYRSRANTGDDRKRLAGHYTEARSEGWSTATESQELGYLSIYYPLASLCNVLLRSGLDEAMLRNHGGAG